MHDAKDTVEQHYGHGALLDAILNRLRESGKDLDRLSLQDLAPVDEFHIRGREATLELARRADIQPGCRVLDVGCGLGGSARYLADAHHCHVTGIDLTQEYVDIAADLSRRVNLSERVSFRRASALDLPFPDNSFDVVWTEHVQMNIADKPRFYSEIARVLIPGGILLFHDVFSGNGLALHYPVPWAESAAINYLAAPGEIQEILTPLGLAIEAWDDASDRSLNWFAKATEKLKTLPSPPFGIGLLMGSTAKDKFENMIRNLREKRFVVVQAVAKKAP